MASLGLFGDDEAESKAAPKEADVFKFNGTIAEQDKPLEMPDTSESYEPQVSRLPPVLRNRRCYRQPELRASQMRAIHRFSIAPPRACAAAHEAAHAGQGDAGALRD